MLTDLSLPLFEIPINTVLEKYGLTEFIPLVEGIRKGDLRTFQDGLVKNQDRFIRYVQVT